MLHAWLNAGFLEEGHFYPSVAGTPQGPILSPVLANLTLDGLEQALRERFPQTRQKSTTKVNLIRFADDFLITGDSYELLDQEVKPLVEAFLRNEGSRSPQKRPSLRISTREWISSDNTYGSMGENCSLRHPRRACTPSWTKRERFSTRTNRPQLVISLANSIR